MEEKYIVKILNYPMTQMLFNNIENKNLQENIIQIINNSVEKGEIKLKTIKSEHLNFRRGLLATSKMKQLERKHHRYIFILHDDIVIGFLKSRIDDRYEFNIISFMIVNENFRNIGIGRRLLNIYFNKVAIKKKYKIILDNNQTNYINYFKKFGFEVTEEKTRSGEILMIKN